MYGLNLYIPAHDTDYVSNLNWYGSGDVNGDGKIDMKDYNSTIYSTHPYYDGTYRGDVNLNGIAGDAGDKKIILEFIEGKIKEINVWELETATQKLNHLKRALAIDPTDKIDAATSGWQCYDYNSQLYTNFTGIYDIKNSNLAKDNGTKIQYDLSHNGIFRIPMRLVNTFVSDGEAHTINVVYFGTPKQQDAGKFEYRVYIEPQTDEIVKPGNYSLNKTANELWYGYSYNNLFKLWGYGSSDLIDYNLNSDSTVTRAWINPNLVKPWNPAENVKYPSDKVLEYPADTSSGANGVPTNLYGIWGKVSHSDVSTQTHDGTRSDVNYIVTRKWQITTGAYTPENTPDVTHEQKIKVEDTTPPTYEVGKNGLIDIKDNSGLPVTVTTDTISTQSSDTTQCSHYTYIKTAEYVMTDVSGNQSRYKSDSVVVSDNPPYLVSLPVPENDTIFVKTGGSISPDTLGWAEWKDPANAPITRYFTDTLLVQTSLYSIWHRVETAGNPCGMSPDTAQYFIYRRSPEGIVQNRLSGGIRLYPNPASGSFTLDYFSNSSRELKVVLYNLQGQKTAEKRYRLSPGKNQLRFRLTNIRPGMYFLKMEDANGRMEVVRLMVRRPSRR